MGEAPYKSAREGVGALSNARGEPGNKATPPTPTNKKNNNKNRKLRTSRHLNPWYREHELEALDAQVPAFMHIDMSLPAACRVSHNNKPD